MPAMSATRDGSQAPPLAALSIRDPSELLFMKEVLDSLTTTLRERLVSPLAGAFIVSWLIINYKVVVVLTSGMKPHVKFPYIEDVIWRDSYGLWMNSLVYPAIAALLYILIYPWPARWLLKYSLYQQNITKLMKITVEGNHPVTREELEEAKQKWAEKFRKQGEAIQRLEVQIEDEQKRVEELTQAEQKMAARANQLALDLEAAKAEAGQAQQELTAFKFDSSDKHSNKKAVLSEGEAYSRGNSLPSDKKFATPEMIEKVLKQILASSAKPLDDGAGPEFDLVKGIAGRDLNAAVVRFFVSALSTYMKVDVKLTQEVIDRFKRLILSFSDSDMDIFWNQVASVRFDLGEYSPGASSAIKEELFG